MSEVPGSACRLLVLVTEPMTAGMETLRAWRRWLESSEATDTDESRLRLSVLTKADEESVVEDGRALDPFTDPVVVKFRGSMVKRSSPTGLGGHANTTEIWSHRWALARQTGRSQNEKKPNYWPRPTPCRTCWRVRLSPRDMCRLRGQKAVQDR